MGMIFKSPLNRPLTVAKYIPHSNLLKKQRHRGTTLCEAYHHKLKMID